MKYVANMHGDETAGHELVLRFAAYLLESYEAGYEPVRKLLNNVRVHLMPTMNPDGYALTLRQFPDGACRGTRQAIRSA